MIRLQRQFARFAACLSLLAVFSQAAMPAFAARGAPDGALPAADICHASGQPASGEAPQAPADQHAGHDCPCCLSGTCAPAVFFDRALAPRTPLARPSAPALAQVAAARDSLFHWFSLLKHGPPA
jgi:hypothetical protein